MCYEMIEHALYFNSPKFHYSNGLCICFNTQSVSDGAMASRFDLKQSSVSIADSEKLWDMSLIKIKLTYSKKEALRR